MRNVIRPRNCPPPHFPLSLPVCTRGCATRDATNPFRLAIPRARGTTRPRVIAFISRTMKPICDVVRTPPAFCFSCVPPSALSFPPCRALFTSLCTCPFFSPFFSLRVSLPYLDIATGDGVPRVDDRLSLSFIVRREMHRGMRILSRAASLGRFDLRGCA